MMSPSDEKRIVAMVDSFTKTVARNFSRNLKRAKANREKHFSDEPIDYLLELLSHDDRYPSDHFVLYADELSCVVHSETLCPKMYSGASRPSSRTAKHQGMREWWTDTQDFCLRIKRAFRWWRCIGSIDLTIW